MMVTGEKVFVIDRFFNVFFSFLLVNSILHIDLPLSHNKVQINSIIKKCVS